MRKILFFLILLPAIVALGHDAYMFSKNPEKGFRISDIGALWDKYHKESHDEWKIKLGKLGEAVNDFNISKQEPEISHVEKQNSANDYSGNFTETYQKGESHYETPDKNQPIVKINKVQNFVGLILEQKALFLFSGLALIIYLINLLMGWIFRERTGMDNLGRLQKKSGKDGGYKYGRK